MFKLTGLIQALLLTCLTVFTASKSDKQLCSNSRGPPGNTECVKFHEYDDYQWSTCLANSYIQTKSAGKHLCLNQYSSYCWYQCQLELYHAESGTVKKTCRCTPGEKPVNTTTSPLPTWCYSPSGDSCNWYRDCLEKRFQCSGTNYGYAIEFGTKFCQECDKNYQSFTSQGRKWLNAVKKCLQVALVPYLRDFNAKSTCKQIRESAIYSHACCYTAGEICTSKGTPSVCDIPCMDWIRAAMITKQAFVDEFTETVAGIWKSVKSCPSASSSFQCLSHFAVYLRYFKMTLKIKKSWNQQLLEINENKIAFDFTKSLVNELKINQSDIDWFFFADKAVEDSENTPFITLNINSVFMDLSLKYKTSEHHITFSKPLHKLESEIFDIINNGSLSLHKEDEGNEIEIEKIYQCEEIKCDKIISTLTPTVASTVTTELSKGTTYHPGTVTVSKGTTSHPGTATVSKGTTSLPGTAAVSKGTTSHPGTATVSKGRTYYPGTATVSKETTYHQGTTTVSKGTTNHPGTTTVSKETTYHENALRTTLQPGTTINQTHQDQISLRSVSLKFSPDFICCILTVVIAIAHIFV